MANSALDMDAENKINPYRPPASAKGFRVKKWKPKYDMIVAGHIMGKSNKELAIDFDVTPVTICNILRADQAQILIKQAHDAMRAKAIEQPVESMDIVARIKQKALEKAEKFLEMDALAENSPFQFIDRTMKLAGIGRESSSSPAPVNVTVNNQNNNAAVVENKEIRTESLQRIAKALEITSG